MQRHKLHLCIKATRLCAIQANPTKSLQVIRRIEGQKNLFFTCRLPLNLMAIIAHPSCNHGRQFFSQHIPCQKKLLHAKSTLDFDNVIMN